MVTLADLLVDSNEKVRNSTTGSLDNTKRTRAINRILEDLQDFIEKIQRFYDIHRGGL